MNSSVQISIQQAFPIALQLERQGRFQEAISLLEQAHQLTKQPLFRFESAGIAIAQGDTATALELLQSISEASPEFEPGQRFLSVVQALEAGTREVGIRRGDVEARVEITGQNWELESLWLEGGFYEPSEIETIVRHLPTGSQFIDVGANAGNHSLYVALARPDVTVVPIEPEPRAAKTLRHNVATNALDNVDLTYVGHAVSASTAPLFLQFRSSSSSTRRSPDGSGIEVPTVDLRTLVKPDTGFVKIDVEGMEVEILDHAWRELQDSGARVMLEVLEGNRAEIDACLERNGFTVVERIPMHAGENIVVERAAQSG